MRLLLTGSNGLLGQKLMKLLMADGHFEVIAVARGKNRLSEQAGYTFRSVDLTIKEEIDAVMAEFKPEVVINTAAMTNVDECELNQEACWKANVGSVEYLVEACEKTSSFFIHISTDFIFDGSEGPLTEEAMPNPVNYYGESKLAAEKIILQSSLQYAIVRTVLVYGIVHDMSRSNIILWVKDNLEQGKSIKVVDDQWRTPTLAEDLAMGCYLIARAKATGIFNISGDDMLTPYDMAQLVAAYFELDNTLITRADSSTFSQPAKRPPKTGFVIDKAQTALGYVPHTFEEGIAELAGQLADIKRSLK